jgi:hypothetical protein
LYKEDFEKFAEGLNEVVDFIKSNNGGSEAIEHNDASFEKEESFTHVEFEDLDE